MVLDRSGVYAFDECSILHLCCIQIPLAYKMFFPTTTLRHINQSKLDSFINALSREKIFVYKFVPSNLENNMIKIANKLLTNYNVQLLGNVFKAQVIDQLETFYDGIQQNFSSIEKKEDDGSIKKVFLQNERKLKKGKNIPGADDIQILAGYVSFNSNGNKYLISEDEHFWGYADIIESQFSIFVIKEWECHKCV